MGLFVDLRAGDTLLLDDGRITIRRVPGRGVGHLEIEAHRSISIKLVRTPNPASDGLPAPNIGASAPSRPKLGLNAAKP